MSQQESKCPVNLTRIKLEKFYNDDSKDGMCSKCHPCKLGIFDAMKIFEAIRRARLEDAALWRHRGREGRRHV
jgi:NADH:ubiquinone oxidoreductase subunit F (NADH-binding)